jgi:Sec-independent protein translocase protein TatA
MLLLSPAKLLVILVVALVVLGPDKLPGMAKKAGRLWSDIRAFREKLESEVRDTFPDLPSTETITQAVRSPLTFLDSLATEPDGDGPVAAAPAAAPEWDVSSPAEALEWDVSSTAAVEWAASSPDEPGWTVAAAPATASHQVGADPFPGPDHPGWN